MSVVGGCLAFDFDLEAFLRELIAFQKFLELGISVSFEPRNGQPFNPLFFLTKILDIPDVNVTRKFFIGAGAGHAEEDAVVEVDPVFAFSAALEAVVISRDL